MLGLKRKARFADRQTLIALRATHTAHRVACDVAYPELPSEPEPVFGQVPIVDFDIAQPYVQSRVWRDDVRDHPVAAIILSAASVTVWFLLWWCLR